MNSERIASCEFPTEFETYVPELVEADVCFVSAPVQPDSIDWLELIVWQKDLGVLPVLREQIYILRDRGPPVRC